MTNSNATTEITCPRCHGFDAFARFGHIAHGKCLRCLGAKTIEVDSWKLAESGRIARETQTANANAVFAGKYTAAAEGMECVGMLFSDFASANEERHARNSREGDTRWAVAKWDGECFRYRDGSAVKWSA